GEPLPDPSLYRTLVGKLIYLTITRHGILFAAKLLRKFSQEPRTPPMKALLKVLSGMEEDDVVDHIANFLEMLDLIKISIFDTNQLPVNIFLLFLTGAARVWWLSEKDNKITSWGMLVGSDEEWEESYNANLPNTTGDSLLEPNVDTHTKQCENGFDIQKAPILSNMDDTQPNEKQCKVEKFKVINYSVGDSEEFLAVRTCECNSWAQTVNGVSNINCDIFSKMDNEWTIHRTK
nr:homogeneously-staining region [Tanacetum cinerariifolium]